MRVLITVKTYPIPSAKYDELVCTAGVSESGDFVRLYPINFRDLPFSQQYRKYQWIEVEAEKHDGHDARKESYRPDCETLQVLGSPIPTRDNWSERARYILKRPASSMEYLQARWKEDRTSLGIIRPRVIHDLIISPDEAHWKPQFHRALAQARLWEDRTVSRSPPRKVPFIFRYRFACDDSHCTGEHEMSLLDWEAGALFWRLRDSGATESEAAQKVRDRFLIDICRPENDVHLFVGMHSVFPTWMVLGLFYPKRTVASRPTEREPGLFDNA